MPDLPGEVEQSRDHYLQREFADLKFSLQEGRMLTPKFRLAS